MSRTGYGAASAAPTAGADLAAGDSSVDEWWPPLSPEQRRWFPRFFDGAENIITYTLGCVIVTFVAPLCIVLPLLYTNDYSKRTRVALWIIFGVLIFLGCAFCAWRTYPVCVGGLCCQPPPARLVSPFTQPRVRRQKITRLGLIINPKSGNGQSARLYSEIVVPILAEYGIEVVRFETTRPGQAHEIAATTDLSRLDCLVIAGGDGSFHELVNGMLARKDSMSVPLGLIPSGSGNAVGHSLGLHRNAIADAVRRLARGEVFSMDVNRVVFRPAKGARPVVRFAAMTVCWGLVGDVGVAAELNRNSTIAKYGSAVWTGLKAAPASVRVTLASGAEAPRVVSGRLVTAFAQNTPHFGEGYYVCPDAKLDDGLMDVALLPHASRGELLRTFAQLPRGAHTGSRKVEFVRATRMEISPGAQAGWLLNVDGEVCPCFGDVKITCIPNAVHVLVATNPHNPPPESELPPVTSGRGSAALVRAVNRLRVVRVLANAKATPDAASVNPATTAMATVARARAARADAAASPAAARQGVASPASLARTPTEPAAVHARLPASTRVPASARAPAQALLAGRARDASANSSSLSYDSSPDRRDWTINATQRAPASVALLARARESVYSYGEYTYTYSTLASDL